MTDFVCMICFLCFFATNLFQYCLILCKVILLHFKGVFSFYDKSDFLNLGIVIPATDLSEQVGAFSISLFVLRLLKIVLFICKDSEELS